MKQLLASLLLLVGTLSALADPPTGFPDIPWGAAQKDVQKAMAARTDVQAGEVKPDELTYKGGAFNGQAVKEWTFDFSAGKFHTAKVLFETRNKKVYDDLLPGLIAKFGKPKKSGGQNTYQTLWEWHSDGRKSISLDSQYSSYGAIVSVTYSIESLKKPASGF